MHSYTTLSAAMIINISKVEYLKKKVHSLVFACCSTCFCLPETQEFYVCCNSKRNILDRTNYQRRSETAPEKRLSGSVGGGKQKRLHI